MSDYTTLKIDIPKAKKSYRCEAIPCDEKRIIKPSEQYVRIAYVDDACIPRSVREHICHFRCLRFYDKSALIPLLEAKGVEYHRTESGLFVLTPMDAPPLPQKGEGAVAEADCGLCQHCKHFQLGGQFPMCTHYDEPFIEEPPDKYTDECEYYEPKETAPSGNGGVGGRSAKREATVGAYEYSNITEV